MCLYLYERRDVLLRVETGSADTHPSVRATFGFPAAFLGECDSPVAAEGSVISFWVYDSPVQYSLLEKSQEHNAVLIWQVQLSLVMFSATWKASGLAGHPPGDTLPGHSNTTC